MIDSEKFKPAEKTIFEVLQKTKFQVPIYQRTYSWEPDKVKQLWEDIIEFYKTEEPFKDPDQKKKYFLGPIVTFNDSNSNFFQIIDGQQRITTLKLLLYVLWSHIKEYTDEILSNNIDFSDAEQRANYSKKSGNVKKARQNIEKCLWKCIEDSLDNFQVDMNSPLLDTSVIDANEKDNLKNIFKPDRTKSDICPADFFTNEHTDTFRQKIIKDKSIHEQNMALLYRLFELEKTKGKDGCFMGVDMPEIVLATLILEYCTLLFVNCCDQKSALKIFNTLNARGQRLAVSDIFKASIYESIKPEDQKGIEYFKKSWSEFSEHVDKYSFKTIKEESASDAMFRYLMHIYRSQETSDTTDPSLQGYFEKDKNHPRLKNG